MAVRGIEATAGCEPRGRGVKSSGRITTHCRPRRKHRYGFTRIRSGADRGEGLMGTNPYSRFTYEELILRDHLAVDRTVLANERTVLSYVRTALALGAAGASLIHFLDSLAADVGGWALIVVGAGLA